MDLLSLGKDPVSATQPAGVDARYDPQFEEVQAEIDKLSSPSATEPTDWDKVVRLASEILVTKSKDLLVAAYLAVGLIQIQGSEGLIIGLRVYADLLETYWQDLYPPKEWHRGRMSALAWWVERTVAALKNLKPEPLLPERIQVLSEDLGRIEVFLGQHLHDPPSLQGLRAFIETIPRIKKELERGPEAFPRPQAPAQSPSAAPPPAAESARYLPKAEPPRPVESSPRSVPGLLVILRGLFKRGRKSHEAPLPEAARAPGPKPPTRGAEPSAPVEFTVYHPQELRPQVWQTLLAYVHVPQAESAVQADSRERLEPEVPVGQRRSTATEEITRGAAIAVVPYLPGCVFNPPAQTLLWLEDWHRAEFRVQAAPDQPGFELGSAVNGIVFFYVGTVLVGEVKIWALLSDREEVTASPPETASARPYRAIFVSYSHKDTEIVTRIGRAYEALGMDFLWDQKVLRSGEKWNPQLLSLIEKADIFQLYWSEAAKSSRYVKEEWHHALAQKRENFLRPLYWKKPMPKPPRELGKLHFAYYAME